jgi:regulator of protease activity HflC (stomatin/prohibitin superfamily)
MTEAATQGYAGGVRSGREFSKVKDAIASWSDIRQLLRGGDQGQLVPVVIPKDRRGFKWLLLVFLAVYFAGLAFYADSRLLALVGAFAAAASVLIAMLWLWRGSIIEIEEGTTGIRSRYGAFVGSLPPGRHYLWWPWDRVEFIVDTSTEIPYTAPVLACPTNENVPLKAIEFFLKFRIEDPVAFVRTIGASNFDLVLSSAVQDAIRQRSRMVRTERAYDLRGSDVGDMQQALNRQLRSYGVRVIGSNIPDVQLPDQYQQHLSTRERIAKELAAYEREWELTRKRRIDTLLMEIERAKKTRDAKLVEVRAAYNKARQDVAQMLEEQETEAQRARWEIEARGRGNLTAAENEAKARRQLALAYRDNRAILAYELARRRLEVGATLAEQAPKPVVVRTTGGGGDSSALSTLLMAQILPRLTENRPILPSAGDLGGAVDAAAEAVERGTGATRDWLGKAEEAVQGQMRRAR